MELVRALAAAYIAITDKYDGGREYKWEQAYVDLHRLESRAYGVRRRVRTRDAILIADLLRVEISQEAERVRKMVPNEAWKYTNNNRGGAKA